MKLRTVRFALIAVLTAALFALPQPVYANPEGEEVVVQDQITIFAHKDAAQNLTDGASFDELLANSADAAEGFLSYAEEVMEAPFTEEATVYLFPDAQARLQGMMDITGISEEQVRYHLAMRGDSPGTIASAISPNPANPAEIQNTIWVRLDPPQGMHISEDRYVGNARRWIVHELAHLWQFQFIIYTSSEGGPTSRSLTFSEGIAEKFAYKTLLREEMTTPETFCQESCGRTISHFYPDNFPDVQDWESSDSWNQLARESNGRIYLLMGMYFTYLHETYNPRGAAEYYQFINQGREPVQAFERAFGVAPNLQDPQFHEFIPEFLDL